MTRKYGDRMERVTSGNDRALSDPIVQLSPQLSLEACKIRIVGFGKEGEIVHIVRAEYLPRPNSKSWQAKKVR